LQNAKLGAYLDAGRKVVASDRGGAMLVGDLNRCVDFNCSDVRHACNIRPELPTRRENVKVIMISAAPLTDAANDSQDDAIARAETVDAFRSAGFDVDSLEDVRNLGVYVTTAVKCPKIGFGLKQETVDACSHLLEREIDLFPNVKSILLMGNTAIRAINAIATRRLGAPAIPSGSAYKVKGHEYAFGEISLFPSYPESGREHSVESNQQDVIAIDIRNAFEVAGGPASRSHRSRPHRGQHRSPEPRPYEVLAQSGESTSAAS
jgi:uracil-DNA glycosylase